MSKPFLPPPWDGLKRDDSDKSASQFVQPAFPVLEQGSNGLECSNPGMSLRDWFAGQALAAMTVAPDYSTGPCNFAMAKRAYIIADRMLEVRSKGGAA